MDCPLVRRVTTPCWRASPTYPVSLGAGHYEPLAVYTQEG